MLNTSNSNKQANTQKGTSNFCAWGASIGMLASTLGSFLAVVGLFLPWAFGQSGFKVVIDMRGYSLSYSLVWLVPLIALGTGSIALLGLLLSFWNKVASRSNIVIAILIVVFVMLTCCPFSLFLSDHLFFMYTTPRKGLEVLGFGFWVTGLGLVISLAGGIIGIVTSARRQSVSK